MRRAAVFVLIAVLALGVWASSASAHLCPTAQEVPVGQATPVSLVITVELVPIPDVELVLPPQLQVDGTIDPPAGWTVQRTGQTLRFRGGPFGVLTCHSFSITVTATRKGVWPVSFVQRDANGKEIAHSVSDPSQLKTPYFEPKIYAGVSIPGPPSSGGGISITVIAGIVLIGGAALLLGGRLVWSVLQNRRDDEIEDRLDAFREQTRERRSARDQE